MCLFGPALVRNGGPFPENFLIFSDLRFWKRHHKCHLCLTDVAVFHSHGQVHDFHQIKQRHGRTPYGRTGPSGRRDDDDLA